jgi:class 3 adenylate cyclase/TolB-like protein
MAAGRVERRLAAVLAADVVGYSRLMERDEQGTLERLKVRRKELIDPLIAEHRGRVVKLMGDGSLVEFASVVDAVACAVAIQEGMAGRERDMPEPERIRFRIGVNLGDVIVEGEDIYGDGVNVAARLEGLAEPGGICVSGKVREELRKRLELAFAPMGRQRVKNIAEPVEAWRVVLGGVTSARRFLRVPRVARRAVAAAVGLLLLIAAGVGGWWWRQAGEAAGPPLPDKPSVVVLPFDNPTGDARLGRLADGMVGNVIADLPRFGVFVIARGTSFTYQGKPHDARSIGRELGVGFLVEGSLQGDGQRLRATIHLVDTGTGAEVWSERYDRPLDDLFAVQDELAQRIVNSIGGTRGAVRRAQIEAARSKPAEALKAFDLYLLAEEVRRTRDEQSELKAQELIRRAIDLDPTFARAYGVLAATYRRQVQNQWAPRDAAMAGWLAAAKRAVELDPNDGWARIVLSDRYAASNDLALSASELMRAADLAEGDGALMLEVGGNLPWVGQTRRGVDLVERGLRLDPGLVDESRWRQRNVYFFARRFEEAAAETEASDDRHWPDLWKTLIYAQLGRTAEMARWRANLPPDLTAEGIFSDTGDFLLPQAAAERALFLDGITKAGLRICDTPELVAKYPDARRLPECEAERAKAAASKS